MDVDGIEYRSIWFDQEDQTVKIIDQRQLPHIFKVEVVNSFEKYVTIIKDMWVRGAPLIGATVAYGFYQSFCEWDGEGLEERVEETAKRLLNTRPTAVNLEWAIEKSAELIFKLSDRSKPNITRNLLLNAQRVCDADVTTNSKIGDYGMWLIEEIYKQKKDKVNILTHCNAGWLATVDWGYCNGTDV